MKKIISVTAAIAAILTGNLAAFADFNSVHKSVVEGKIKIHIPGTANTQMTYYPLGPAKPQILILNNCGWGKIKNTFTSEIMDIMGQDQQLQLQIDYNPLGEEKPAPTCATTGNTYTDSNVAQPIGTAFRNGTTIWIKGATAAGVLAIETQARLTKITKVNACGWATITPSEINPMESFKVGTTEYMLNDVLSGSNPMLCKKTATGYTRYVPATGF